MPLLVLGMAGCGENPTPSPTPTVGVTYTITALPEWITNDGCIIFAWTWGNGSEGAWSSCKMGEGEKPTTLSFNVDAERTGALLVRCKEGTTTPDWNQKEDAAGRIYNKTADMTLTSGTTSYKSAEWAEYIPA